MRTVVLSLSLVLTFACNREMSAPQAQASAAAPSSVPRINFQVSPPVSPVAQTGRPNGCWAASAAMVWGWVHNQSIGMEGIASQAGGNFSQLLTSNATLSEADVARFASAIGLHSEAPRSYTVNGFLDLLQRHGPLWFGTQEQAGKHARVVTGLQGDGTADGTTVFLIDPATGTVATDTFRKAMEKYELVATGAVTSGADLTVQIFHR